MCAVPLQPNTSHYLTAGMVSEHRSNFSYVVVGQCVFVGIMRAVVLVAAASLVFGGFAAHPTSVTVFVQKFFSVFAVLFIRFTIHFFFPAFFEF